MYLTESTNKYLLKYLALLIWLEGHSEEEMQKIMAFASPFNRYGEKYHFVVFVACQHLLMRHTAPPPKKKKKINTLKLDP